MNAFPARFHGLCMPCGEDIQVGESIANHPDHGYIHEDCWGDADNIPQMPGERRSPRDHTPVTMPRGKTAKDRCGRCFIVHASGQVDCE
jgi:hypothetical protein